MLMNKVIAIAAPMARVSKRSLWQVLKDALPRPAVAARPSSSGGAEEESDAEERLQMSCY